MYFCFSGTGQECPTFTDLTVSHALIGTDLKVQLLLNTRQNQNCSENLHEHDLANSTYLNATKKTIFIIHGFRPTGSPPVWINGLKDLLLEKEDVNIITVDWNRGATNLYYPTAVSNVKNVAEILTRYIDQMMVRNLSLSLCDIHLYLNRHTLLYITDIRDHTNNLV